MRFFLTFLLFSTFSFADVYELYLRKVGDNLYSTTDESFIIKTMVCLEMPLGDKVLFDSSKQVLMFKGFGDRTNDCYISKIYQALD